jgi:hypothetical protein
MLGPNRAVRVDLASTRSLAADGPAVFSDCRRKYDLGILTPVRAAGE